MKKQKEEQAHMKEMTFMQQLSILPEVVKHRFIGQLAAAVLIVLLSILMMIHFRAWQYCVGLLIALYIAFLAMDLVWSYNKGKIECHRMVCIKAQNLIRKGRVFVIMQEIGSEEVNEQNTKQFYIATSKKKALLITPQTVMDVYFKPNNPLEIIAWEIVGNNGST